jgi:hypothetical protein
MPSSGTLGPGALVRIDVSEECSASIIWVTRICELGTTTYAAKIFIAGNSKRTKASTINLRRLSVKRSDFHKA